LFQTENISVWPIFAGLGLFLFGMFMLEEALKNLAGRSFKLFLRKHTGHPLRAIFSGTLVTAILQSSSLVTLLVMSLAGAGIIGLKNGIGMIMGANLGTTATGWLVSQVGFKLDIEAFILPFIAIGGLGIAFLKSEKLSNYSKLLMGFSLMFLGLSYLKNNFSDLAQTVDLSVLKDKPMILFALFGFVFTALIQSSSASMTIYLSTLAAGIISFPQAAYLVVGSDLGTSVTGVIGTLSGNAIRKKVGWAQFLFNLINASLAFLIIDGLFYIINHWFSALDQISSLVLFHSLFNFCGILFVYPFLKSFTGLLEKYVRADKTRISTYITEGIERESTSGTEILQKEAVVFIQETLRFNRHFFEVEKDGGGVMQYYLRLRQYETEISKYYLLLQQSKPAAVETRIINNMIASVRNAALSAKDLKDIKHNLDEVKNSVSGTSQTLLKQIVINQQNLYVRLDEILRHLDEVTVSDIEKLDNMQDEFYREETHNLYNFLTKDSRESEFEAFLNMLREINSSNESVLKSFKHYIANSSLTFTE